MSEEIKSYIGLYLGAITSFFGVWAYLMYSLGRDSQHDVGVLQRAAQLPHLSIEDALIQRKYRTLRVFNGDESLPIAPFNKWERPNWGYSDNPDKLERKDIQEGKIVRVGLEGIVHEASSVQNEELTIRLPLTPIIYKTFTFPIDYQILKVDGHDVYFAHSNKFRPPFVLVGGIMSDREIRYEPPPIQFIPIEVGDHVVLIGMYITEKVKEFNKVASRLRGLQPNMLFVADSYPWHGTEMLDSLDKKRMEKFNHFWNRRRTGEYMELVKFPGFYEDRPPV